MVEIFKTTVKSEMDTERILSILKEQFPKARINFDLEDIDNILRVEDTTVNVQKVQIILEQNGHEALRIY